MSRNFHQGIKGSIERCHKIVNVLRHDLLASFAYLDRMPVLKSLAVRSFIDMVIKILPCYFYSTGQLHANMLWQHWVCRNANFKIMKWDWLSKNGNNESRNGYPCVYCSSLRICCDVFNYVLNLLNTIL